MLKCLDWMEREGIAQLDPDPQAVARFNGRLQRDLKKMVLASFYIVSDRYNFFSHMLFGGKVIFYRLRLKPSSRVAGFWC